MRRPYVDPAELTMLQALGLPGSGAGPRTRASDAERDRAADALRTHHTDGRLTTEEFEERTQRAYAATTLGDLDELFTDLPRMREPDIERQWHPRFSPLPLIALLVVLVALASAHVVFFIWPLVLFGLFRFASARRRWWGRPRGYGWPV